MSDALDIAPADWTVGEVVTAAKMNTELRDKIIAVADRLTDTGWIDIPLLGTSGVTEKVNCQYRIKSGVVYLRGSIAYSGSGWFDIGTLPAEAAPSTTLGYPASANTAAAMFLNVETSGVVQGWLEVSSGAWLNLTGVSYPLG